MKKLIAVVACLFILGSCKKNEEAPPPVATKPASQSNTAAPVTPSSTATLPAAAPIPTNGLALWLAADDAKPAADAKLASWSNPAVNGVTATAGKPQLQPTVVANALNGHAVVRFDGEKNMLMTNIDISPAHMPEATVFTVFSSKTDAASPLRKLYGDDNGSYDRAVGLDHRGGEGKNYGVFTGKGVSGYFALRANEVYVTADQFTTQDFSGWVDGKQMLTKVPAEWGPALPNMYIGGSGTSYAEYWQGDIAEIIVYARVLTDPERMQVEDYLGKKYGVVISR